MKLPKYITFDCYGTLIDFQMNKTTVEILGERADQVFDPAREVSPLRHRLYGPSGSSASAVTGGIAEAFSKYWSLTIVPPWVGFSAFVQRAISQDYTFNDSIDLVLFLIVTLLCILAIGSLRVAFSIYLWITLALILMRGHATHLFPGFMRYSMALFPVFWLIPKIVTNRYLELSLWILSILVQFILLWMFLNWFWVA